MDQISFYCSIFWHDVNLSQFNWPIVSEPGGFAVYERCLSEVLQVAQKSGIDVGKNEYDKIMQRCEEYKHKDMQAKSSMFVDIENGRQTETESLQGTVCRLAEKLGIDVPINQLIYQSIRLYNKQFVSERSNYKDDVMATDSKDRQCSLKS